MGNGVQAHRNYPLSNLSNGWVISGMFKCYQVLQKSNEKLTIQQILMVYVIYMLRLKGNDQYKLRELYNFFTKELVGLDLDDNYIHFKRSHTDLKRKGLIKKQEGTHRFSLTYKAVKEVIEYIDYAKRYAEKKYNEYRHNFICL